MKAKLEQIADALGIELPPLYCDFVRKLAKSKRMRAALEDAVCLDPEQLIELNEHLSSAVPLAGLDEWPDNYFVIGEDGCGNYYLIDGSDDSEPVLFFDHEQDAICRAADSLEEFANRQLEGIPLETTVLHSGAATRRRKAKRKPATITPIVFAKDAPAWSQDWCEFVRTFVEIATRRQSESKRTLAFNQEFASKPVCWTGKLKELDLGKYKSARIEMPVCKNIPGAEKFDNLYSLCVGLRTEEEDYEHAQSISPHIRTSLAAWRAANIGDKIRFEMMFVPGHEDTVSCIRVEKYDELEYPYVAIPDCGAHLVEVIRRGSG